MNHLLHAVGATSEPDHLEQLKATLSSGQIQGASLKRPRLEDFAGSGEQQSPGRWPIGDALPLPPALAVLNGSGGQGFHPSGSDSPDGEDEGAMQRTGSGPADRTQATKDKNRKAQQRFRLRQKEKMLAMEAENVRLRAMLAEHAIPLPPPLPALLAGGTGTAPDVDGAPAAAAAGPRGLLGPEHASASAMYDEVQGVLDATPGIPPRALVTYLQAWARELTDDEKAVHRHTLVKWHDCGSADRVRMWVEAAARPEAGARPVDVQAPPIEAVWDAATAGIAPAVQGVPDPAVAAAGRQAGARGLHAAAGPPSKGERGSVPARSLLAAV